MKRFLNIITGPVVAAVFCLLLSGGSIFLAFKGSQSSCVLMSTPPALGFSALVLLLLAVRGVLTLFRRRFDSAILHLGCALVVAGWLWGVVESRRVAAARPDHSAMMNMLHSNGETGKTRAPLSGSMALAEGDVMNSLWEGTYLDQFVGKLDFSVKLDRFAIEYYEGSEHDRMQGRMPPIKEYCSRVIVSEPGKDTFTRDIRVNQPVRIGDYLVYQMSWGQSTNRQNQPVTYTVLKFVRDPGLRIVYAGFTMLFIGIVLFTGKVIRMVPQIEEVDRAD